MPRSAQEQIAKRQVINSSQSANVPLQVTAGLGQVSGAGAAMWGVASALRGLAGAGVGIAKEEQHRAKVQQVAQAKQDFADGKAAAQERAVTGQAPDLEGMSQTYVQAYQQTDGLRLADDFGNQLQPELAKLEPGADVNKFIQDKANQFLQDNVQDDTARQSFMAAVAHAQPQWKDQYLRGSIAESMKREGENLGALATTGIHSGALLTSDGLKQFYDTMGARGLSETEAHQVLAQAYTASIAAGEGDIGKMMEVLKTPLGSDGTVLADVPAFKSQFAAAAKRGQAIIDANLRKSQAGELTHVYEHLYDKADQGILSDHEIDVVREKYKLTPEWAAGMHNRNREAQQRFAKEQAKGASDAELIAAGMSGDNLRIAAAGLNKVGAAMSAWAAKAYMSGDVQQFVKIVKNGTAANAPMPILGDVFKQFDPSDVKNAEKALTIYDALDAQSAAYAGQYVPPKVAAMFKRYHTMVNTFGFSPEQALQNLAQQQPLDSGVAHAMASKAIKANASIIQTDFNDNPFYKSDTKIANMGYVRQQVQDIATEMASSGHLDGKDLVEAAWKKFTETNIKVGDVYQPVPTGARKDVGPALTELGNNWKDKLVKEGKMPEDSITYWQVAANDPGKWVLMRNDDGSARAVTDPKTGFVEVSADDVATKYHKWQSDTSRQEATRAQGLRQLGLGSIDPKDTAALKAAAAQQAAAPQDYSLSDILAVREGRKSAKDVKPLQDNSQNVPKLNNLLDTTTTSSFIDYLHSTQ